MSVVSEKVGGRRGKELIAPIVMNGTYTAIRRVQEARRKEILQVRQGQDAPVGIERQKLESLATEEINCSISGLIARAPSCCANAMPIVP